MMDGLFLEGDCFFCCCCVVSAAYGLIRQPASFNRPRIDDGNAQKKEMDRDIGKIS